MGFAAGVVVALLVAVAVLYFADLEVVESSDADLVSVPHVLGQDTSDAEAELRDAGLTADVNEIELESPTGEPTFEIGPTREPTIRTQNPDAGTEVEPDTSVTITVK